MGGDPNFVSGQVPTPEEWDGYFTTKADDVLFTGDAGAGGVRGLVPPPPAGAGPAGWVLRATGVFGPVPTGPPGPPGPGIVTVVDYDVAADGGTYTFGAVVADVAAVGLVPATELATFTVVLPTSPTDAMAVEIFTTEVVDALTVSPGGAETVLGGFLTLTANGGISFRYRLSNTTWYRRY